MSRDEPYLKIFKNKSVLFNGDNEEEFIEGKPSPTANIRVEKVRSQLSKGFLNDLIDQALNPDNLPPVLKEEHKLLFKKLVEFTSENGRAVVGLTILQLCIKSIVPDQSVRLHKSGRGDFSWAEGVPMRSLDRNFITPILREKNLLKINAHGFMMTRTLAENYPYSQIYKAAIRGSKKEWLEIVDLLEKNELDAYQGLKYLIILLSNRSGEFLLLSDQTLNKIYDFLQQNPSIDSISSNILKFVKDSSYSARLLEVAMHSLMQVIGEESVFEGTLKPLSQMRSANKKHGNIGDIEITSPSNSSYIVESWDAKYGKPYLRDELEELKDKLEVHEETNLVGFVTDINPDLKKEIIEKLNEINESSNIQIQILSFSEWVKFQLARLEPEYPRDDAAKKWFVYFAESLCQRRRDIAPIDEPCDEWVRELSEFMDNV